jgi:hypothetical protein
MIRFLFYISAILFFATTKLSAQIEAVYIQDRVEITWTYTECNQLSHFVIEKSKNGTSFREFLRLKNSGVCTVFLETDHTPYNGSSYYRIRYVNKNGTYFYSETVAVKKTINSQQIPTKLKGFNSLNTLVVLKDKSNGEFYAKLNIQEMNGILISETLNENLKNGNFIIVAAEKDELVGNKLTIINRNPTGIVVDTLNTKRP